MVVGVIHKAVSPKHDYENPTLCCAKLSSKDAHARSSSRWDKVTCAKCLSKRDGAPPCPGCGSTKRECDSTSLGFYAWYVHKPWCPAANSIARGKTEAEAYRRLNRRSRSRATKDGVVSCPVCGSTKIRSDRRFGVSDSSRFSVWYIHNSDCWFDSVGFGKTLKQALAKLYRRR